MYPELDKIKPILLHGNYISEADSKAAEAVSHDTLSYVDYLIQQELLTKTLLGQAIAESLKIPYADLDTSPPDKEAVAKIPEELARQVRAIVFEISDKEVTIATDTPENIKSELEELFPKLKLRVAYTLPEYIDTAFLLYERPLDTRFSQIIESGKRIAPEMVDEIIKDALSFRSSDIHFEPQAAGEVVIRFRVDGTLHEAGRLPKEHYENILNRIKIESGMRIDEHFSAQDGAMQHESDGRKVDLRVSLVPTITGEKVVMRLLGSYIQNFGLVDIGLDDSLREKLEECAKKPFGMILSVGPTGSGKTTTLYALIKLLNKPNINITSIEDPVEYKVSGINQIQVREQSNLTFAKGLRSIVRQDPNVILVGEIRDPETAEIAVNAALTGHLLLSTFHANDAATAVPRLIDMGIEPFLLASTLEAVVAQRLVRKICEHCRYSMPMSEAIQDLKLNHLPIVRYFRMDNNVYRGKGCEVCHHTGYKGRTALFEIIEVTQPIQELIIKSPSALEIQHMAHEQGNKSMFEDGIQKIKRGTTTIEEVLRVSEPPLAEAKHKRA